MNNNIPTAGTLICLTTFKKSVIIDLITNILTTLHVFRSHCKSENGSQPFFSSSAMNLTIKTFLKAFRLWPKRTNSTKWDQKNWFCITIVSKDFKAIGKTIYVFKSFAPHSRLFNSSTCTDRVPMHFVMYASVCEQWATNKTSHNFGNAR